MQIEPIAHIHTDFPTKFGVPRQSGLASELTSTIVFAPAYRNPDCLRGIADFSHLWLIWEFDKVAGAGWSPTVLPPKRGRVCHALAVPAEPAGALVRAAPKGGAAHEGRAGPVRRGRRSGRRHADLRH